MFEGLDPFEHPGSDAHSGSMSTFVALNRHSPLETRALPPMTTPPGTITIEWGASPL
jgi:hypothetical protein